ncbi:UDP-N-acetylmuramate dehydrogenase [SAR86 cluster bacterium]|jgi:UDP-N-acetylmuramate dehydrogenase|nr:UDP-N-acetylmuramate dehydrogenase [SAR86 cluster bacterium]
MKLSNKIKKSFSLKENNLLKIDSTAKFFIEIFDLEDLKNIQNFTSTKKINFCILGEGSNVVLPNLLNKFVIKISFNEISIEDNLITVGAGKNWDDFVLWSLENGYCGLENLSGIPGSIGAAPIQNIGAYGSEVSDFIDEVICFDMDSNSLVSFTNNDCKFSYRQSIFQDKDSLIVIKVKFKLTKDFQPNLEYEDLNFLKAEEITPFIIRKHILKIRKAKISDPKEHPNVGSFFKNPIISLDELEKIKQILPKIKFYSYIDNKVKISAAFLIESLSLKGFVLNNARVSEKHSLVLENKSEKSEDILDLASHIQASVLENYNINLELEPQIF